MTGVEVLLHFAFSVTALDQHAQRFLGICITSNSISKECISVARQQQITLRGSFDSSDYALGGLIHFCGVFYFHTYMIYSLAQQQRRWRWL
jgi:hypothetical protein